MRVSVVVPVYNVAPYLRQCLDSLVGQTLREIEIICVDDGSTDGSGAILDEYAEKDPRVKAIHQPNAGAGAARNAGLARATGEYLFFCDPDDWCAPDLLAQMADCARSVSADVVLAGYTKVDAASGRVIGTHPPHRRWPQDSVFSGHDVRNRVFNLARHTVWDKLFRREFVLANGIRFQPVRHYNDMLFCDLSLGLARRMTVLPVTGYMHVLSRPGGIAGYGAEIARTYP